MQTISPSDRTIIFVVIALAIVVIVAQRWGTEYLFEPLESNQESISPKSVSTPPFHVCDQDSSFTSLVAALQQPQQACSLVLRSTSLQQLPTTIGTLTELRVLDISDNHLTELLEEIGWLRKLEEFNISNNQIKEIPAHIGWLRELRQLDVSNNQLTTLPDEIGWLQKLERLDIRGNPLPQEEIEKARRYLPSASIVTQ